MKQQDSTIPGCALRATEKESLHSIFGQCLDLLLRAELSVGTGEDRFTMRHGSFSYRQKHSARTRLRRLEPEETAGGLRLLFEHPKTGERLALFARETENGCLRVSPELPPDCGWDRFRLTLPSDPDEHFYGCGEVHSTLDLKGKRVRIWVAEHQNARRIGDKLIREKLIGRRPDFILPFRNYESYYAQPTFVSSRKYFLHADTSAYAVFDFTKPDRAVLRFRGLPVLYLGEAESFPALSEKLSGLLGRQRSLPDWIYDGAILAIQEGTDAVERRMQAALDAGARICGVWSQDWCGCRRTGFGYQVMWNWEWDRELYPGLDEKILEWRARGVRFLGYINPFLALEKGLYRHAAERGWCVRDREGADYLVTITTFPAAMIDLTNPEAYEWYKTVIKENMIGLGMGGWMADFGEYLPTDAVLHSGEDPALIHNRWPSIWARLNREAIEECGAQDEVFFFTRAGHTETVRESPMMWTGDQHVDWSLDDGLASAIPATLSLAMSGCGVTHSDVGGYTTVMHMTRGKELLLRWMEMNAFTPLMRFHEGNQPSRNVQFDTDGELLTHLALTSGWHAALKKYIRSLVEETERTGVPVMRPLFYHYDEPEAYTKRTEYLLGRDILVAPVVREGARDRTVYLPRDEWVDLFTGEEFSGGERRIGAPLGQPTVFIRKQSPWLHTIHLNKGGTQT